MLSSSIHFGFPKIISCFSHFEAKKSPFDDFNSLETLANTLTSQDWNLDRCLMSKEEIRIFIHKHQDNGAALDAFLDKMTEWGLQQNPQKTMALLVDIISLDLITKAVQFKNRKKTENGEVVEESAPQQLNIFKWASMHASEYPVVSDTTMKGRLYSEWKKCRPIVLYSIPNLVNIILGAFNFLDSHKKYVTLWEKHLLLEMVCKFFVIPYCLVQLLHPFFAVTAKVYLAAALIIAATGTLISCYQRWFRPLPAGIIYCTNLDEQMEMGIIDHKVAQNEMIDLIKALEVDKSIFLVGPSGEGKTALIHRFIQLKREGKLSKKLQELTVYEVDCGVMISSMSFGHSELINQIKGQIEGYEGKVLLFFDEFHQIVSNKAAFEAFKKMFLVDEPRVKFVAAMTRQKCEDLEKIDQDRSFRRRIRDIEVKPLADDQIRMMIKNFWFSKASDIPMNEEAIETIVDISKNKDFLPEIGRAHKAKEIFEIAAGECRAAYLDSQSNRKEIRKIKSILAHQQRMYHAYYRLTHLFKNYVVQKDRKKFEEIDIDRNHLDKLDIDKDSETEDFNRPLVCKESISLNDQIVYHWYHFYALKKMEEILKSQIDKIDSKIPFQMNKALIDKVYNEILAKEKRDKGIKKRAI